jgi:hypothetical protein
MGSGPRGLAGPHDNPIPVVSKTEGITTGLKIPLDDEISGIFEVRSLIEILTQMHFSSERLVGLGIAKPEKNGSHSLS